MELKNQSISCVLVGKFNPAIIHPAWLLNKKLIRDAEAQKAKVEVVHDQISAFSIANINVRATSNQFLISSTNEAMWESVRDWTLGIFTYLAETPVSGLGINLDSEYEIGDKKKWDGLGDTMVPKVEWAKILDNPKLRTLRLQSANPDDKKGYIWVTTEPSAKFRFGVTVQINNHFNLLNEDGSSLGGNGVVKCLNSHWGTALARSKKITKDVLDLKS